MSKLPKPPVTEKAESQTLPGETDAGGTPPPPQPTGADLPPEESTPSVDKIDELKADAVAPDANAEKIDEPVVAELKDEPKVTVAELAVTSTALLREETPIRPEITCDPSNQEAIAYVMELRNAPPSKMVATLFLVLDGYILNAGPRVPVDNATIQTFQRNLLVTLKNALKADFVEFRHVWAALVNYFLVYGGDKRKVLTAISERYLFRNPDAWRNNEDDFKLLVSLISLVRISTMTKDREKVRKEFDFERLASLGVSPDGQQNLFKFYGI